VCEAGHEKNVRKGGTRKNTAAGELVIFVNTQYSEPCRCNPRETKKAGKSYWCSRELADHDRSKDSGENLNSMQDTTVFLHYALLI
jgi:hypothetical protein